MHGGKLPLPPCPLRPAPPTAVGRCAKDTATPVPPLDAQVTANHPEAPRGVIRLPMWKTVTSHCAVLPGSSREPQGVSRWCLCGLQKTSQRIPTVRERDPIGSTCHSRLGDSRLGDSRLGDSRLGDSRLVHSRLGRLPVLNLGAVVRCVGERESQLVGGARGSAAADFVLWQLEVANLLGERCVGVWSSRGAVGLSACATNRAHRKREAPANNPASTRHTMGLRLR